MQNANSARRSRGWQLLLSSWLVLGCAGTTTLVQSALPQGISVSGHGEAEGEPDIARITIGIETRERIATDATERANQQMNGILTAIKQKGVADADIRTRDFSINFEPEPYPPGPYPSEGHAAPEPREAKAADKNAAESKSSEASGAPRGFYRVSNTVVLKVRKLPDLGAILGAATAAGANNIWGIQFDVEDPSKLEAEARTKAVEQAKSRAAELARLAGVTLGHVVSVAEGGGGVSRRDDGYGYSMKAANVSVPVESGQLTVTQDVQVVFAIK